jgi:anti-sigma B factor antagonist
VLDRPITLPRVPWVDPGFSLHTEVAAAVTVVRASGEIDSDTAPALTAHVERLVARHPLLLLVLDLAGVEFLGAAGITALLQVDDLVRDHGGHLLLRAPSAQVRTVLRLGRAFELFDIQASNCDLPAAVGTADIHIPHQTG